VYALNLYKNSQEDARLNIRTCVALIPSSQPLDNIEVTGGTEASDDAPPANRTLTVPLTESAVAVLVSNPPKLFSQ